VPPTGGQGGGARRDGWKWGGDRRSTRGATNKCIPQQAGIRPPSTPPRRVHPTGVGTVALDPWSVVEGMEGGGSAPPRVSGRPIWRATKRRASASHRSCWPLGGGGGGRTVIPVAYDPITIVDHLWLMEGGAFGRCFDRPTEGDGLGSETRKKFGNRTNLTALADNKNVCMYCAGGHSIPGSDGTVPNPSPPPGRYWYSRYRPRGPVLTGTTSTTASCPSPRAAPARRSSRTTTWDSATGPGARRRPRTPGHRSTTTAPRGRGGGWGRRGAGRSSRPPSGGA